MGQKSTSDIRMEKRTLPLGKMRSKTLGMMMLCKWPFFSFLKNKSGFQIFSGSVRTKKLMRPFMLSYCNRSSFHSSRNVIWIEYSWERSDVSPALLPTPHTHHRDVVDPRNGANQHVDPNDSWRIQSICICKSNHVSGQDK